MNMTTLRRHPLRAFTLIELLVVISIIALLAGLVISLLPGINEKKVRARVRTELEKLELAINAYKAKVGFYPPDNPLNSGQSPLYYELTGTQRIDRNDGSPPTFRDRDMRPFPFPMSDITTNLIGTYFNTSGFINSEGEMNERKEYCPNLKSNSNYRAIPGTASPGIQLLLVPYQGTNGDFNPWHYNSSNPQHHPEGFDLWAVVVVGDKTITIGNWKD